jgi:ketosteroid isomerase-like protein
MEAGVLDVTDRQAITELIALHGHLVDAGELERLGEVLTEDVVYDWSDVSDVGGGVTRGLKGNRRVALELGDRNPVGHLVTNTVITEAADGSVLARSKAIAIMGDGRAGTATYHDTVIRTPRGWRVSHRVIEARRVPLGGRTAESG